KYLYWRKRKPVGASVTGLNDDEKLAVTACFHGRLARSQKLGSADPKLKEVCATLAFHSLVRRRFGHVRGNLFVSDLFVLVTSRPATGTWVGFPSTNNQHRQNRSFGPDHAAWRATSISRSCANRKLSVSLEISAVPSRPGHHSGGSRDRQTAQNPFGS